MSDDNTFVVGVDGSHGGHRALRWAIREAARSAATVAAVMAWQWDGFDGSLISATGPEAERQRAERILAEQVASAAIGSDVAVTTEAVQGSPAAVLTRAARGARALVLGSHGHSRLRQAVLGSVTEECVRGASCPVVVVPVPRTSRAEPAERSLRN